MNSHPYHHQKKERTGFGRWSLIIYRLCKESGKFVRIVKNWHGPRPVGSIECPHCHKFMDL